MLPLLLLCAGTGAAAAAPRHNVVFILADDYGWADSGWHRLDDKDPSTDVMTPNMNALVKEGIEQGCQLTGVPGVPQQDPLAPRRGPLGSSPDRESAIGNAPALVPGPLARL